MKKIVLMGNPNVGKSVVFSRLTGANVISSNYPGTTIDFSKGKMKINDEFVEIIDAPGTYSLEPSNKAEEVAVKMLKDADVVVDVIDATNLERNLYLTLELLERNIPVVILLNLWDETKHLGIHIDEQQLEQLLEVPVVPTVALTGEGIKSLVAHLSHARTNEKIKPTSEEGRWVEIGSIINKIERVEHRHHTIRERLSDLTIRPLTGLPIAALVIFGVFWIVRFIGETLGSGITILFEHGYQPLVMALSDWLGSGTILHDILIGQLIEGEIQFELSMGMLTTGLFVPFAMVLPYIISFYLMLSMLEDTGYLPRLATLVDNIFHKLGMHGYGIIPTLLGFGCNVPGALATRAMETPKQRFIAATLLAIAVPCMAQMAMIFGILGPYGLYYIGLVFLSLVIVYLVLGLILNKMVKGTSPEIFLEIPPYRRPSGKALVKKTWMRIRWFLKEAIPFLFLGILVINILYALGVLQWLSNILSPVMSIFGLPGGASIAMVTGFLRKDLAVGMLLPLGMNPLQLVIAATMLTMYFPCIAAFVVLLKELGIKNMIKSALIMASTAAIVGFILRVILLGI
jgi:ferrous iron transport protein B